MNELNQPKISVITCTFNSEKFLEKALESVENQSYSQIEHIINDSDSNDATLEIIRDYIDRNGSRYTIKLIHCEPKGVGNALNVAAKHATGEIIHFLHSDDYYVDPNSLQKVARYFSENPEIVWLTGNFLIDWKGRRLVLPQTLILKPSLEIALSITNFISHENTFMRTEALHEYGGFNETKAIPVEYTLWLKLFKHHRPLIVNDEFAVFIIHKGSTSTGNIFKLMKALSRGFHAQRKVDILPFLGYYKEKKGYMKYKKIQKKVTKFRFIQLLGPFGLE